MDYQERPNTNFNPHARMKDLDAQLRVELDLSKITNIEFDGIDHKDFPDYCDAYIIRADYNGVEMTVTQIEELNEYFHIVLQVQK